MSKLQVKQIRSTIKQPPRVKKILWALGLRGMHQENTLKDNNCIRGMVNKISQFVEVKVVD